MKRNLLRTMLVGMAMLAGEVNGAWADTYEILYGTLTYDDNGGTTVLPQTDFSGDANEKTGITFADANGSKCIAAMPIGGSVLYANTSSSWTKNFSSAVKEGKVYFAGNYSVSANDTQTFKIVDSQGNAIFASTQTSTTSSNVEGVVATICGNEIKKYVRQPRKCAYGVKSLCIDLDAKKVTYDLLVSSGNNSYSELTGSVELSSDISDVQGLSVQRTSYGCYLDSVMLYSQKSEETKYEYTINYKLGETTVKTTSANVAAGTEVTSETVVYGTTDGTKYFATADAQTLTVSADGGNTLDVAVRKANSATLSLTTTVGGTSSTTTTTFIEADDNSCSWSYAYPLYVLQDGKYYKADDTETFGGSGTFTDGETITKAVTYTAADEDVVFFAEGESATANETVNYQYSNGLTGHISAQNARNRGISVGTLEAGAYEMVVNVTGNETRGVAVRNSTSTDTAVDTLAQINTTGVQKVSFVLYDDSTPLVINGKSVIQNGTKKTNQSADFDYVLIKKAETVEVTVGTDSYATYCPTVALDFTNASSIKAYMASVSGSTVALSKVSTVAAGEGVLLHADGGATEAISVATGTVNANDGNNFVGVKEATTLSENSDGKTNFVLSKEDGVVGFFKANSTSIAAGKAYLPVNLTSGAKSLTMVFDGETTGISEVKAAAAENGVYYNLSGQRVAQPTKGLYIVNGKKVIVK